MELHISRVCVSDHRPTEAIMEMESWSSRSRVTGVLKHLQKLNKSAEMDTMAFKPQMLTKTDWKFNADKPETESKAWILRMRETWWQGWIPENFRY